MKILFSWIGHADLLGIAGKSGDEMVMQRVQALVGKNNFSQISPISVTLHQRTFEKIVLLWNYADHELYKTLQTAWGNNTKILPVHIENPTNYGAIYQVACLLLR